MKKEKKEKMKKEMEEMKTFAKRFGINAKPILMGILIPLGIILVGCAVMFGCTQLMEDASAVIGICFPIFVSASAIIGAAPVAAYIGKYVAPDDVYDYYCQPDKIPFTKKADYFFKYVFVFLWSMLGLGLVALVSDLFTMACTDIVTITPFGELDEVFGGCLCGTLILAYSLYMLISIFSKTKKQAIIFNIVAGVAMVIVTAVPFIPAVSAWASAAGIAPYFIPVFNAGVLLGDLLNSSITWANTLIALAADLVIAIIMIVISVFSVFKFGKDKSI